MSRFWRAVLISAVATGAAWAALAWRERQRGPVAAQGTPRVPPIINADHLPAAHRDQMLAELDGLV